MKNKSANKNDVIEVSVVIPVYNGGATVPLVVKRLEALNFNASLEIVLVNDGSADDSNPVCSEIVETSSVSVAFVDLARNYGEHNAVMAGLRHARGKYVVTIDDDLQHDPEEVVALYEKCRDTKSDVVYAQWDEKKHHFLEISAAHLPIKWRPFY